MKKSALGFTLVELLVVISIIAILSVIGITVFSGVQKNARDARRRADIDAIAKAYEMVYTSASPRYRVLTASDFATGIPVAADSKYPYTGILSLGADAYCVCVELEKGDGGNSSNNSCNGVQNGKYYCRANQQ